MKLFVKKASVPKQNRPDYDSIAAMEKEFRLDDNGFDERMDEAILEEFWKTFPEDEDETVEEIEILIDLLRNVLLELNSSRYQDAIMNEAECLEQRRFKLSRRNWDSRHYSLRDNMVARGKRRHN